MIRDADSLRLLASTLAKSHCAAAGGGGGGGGGQHAHGSRRAAPAAPNDASFVSASTVGSPAAQRRARVAPEPSYQGRPQSGMIDALQAMPRRPPPPTDLSTLSGPGDASEHYPVETRERMPVQHAQYNRHHHDDRGANHADYSRSYNHSYLPHRNAPAAPQDSWAADTSAPRARRAPPAAPHADPEDISRIWATPAGTSRAPPLAVDRVATESPLLVSPPRRGQHHGLEMSEVGGGGGGGGNPNGLNDTAALAGRRRFGFAPAATRADADALQPAPMFRSTVSGGSPVRARGGAFATQGADSVAEEQRDASRPERAATNRVEELSRKVVNHQNAHVKLRAQLTLEVDRARWESDQADFKLAELQASLEGFVQALRKRIESRLETVQQLRQDTEQQVAAQVKADIKGLLAAHSQDERDAIKKRSDAVTTLKAMVEQLLNHTDLQIAQLQHDLSDQGTHDPLARLASAKQAVSTAARTEKENLDAIATMMSEFADQARSQLLELKAEREHFEKRLMVRIQEISRMDSRRAPTQADTSLRLMHHSGVPGGNGAAAADDDQ